MDSPQASGSPRLASPPLVRKGSPSGRRPRRSAADCSESNKTLQPADRARSIEELNRELRNIVCEVLRTAGEFSSQDRSNDVEERKYFWGYFD